jgi:acetoin utilization deacetylase AcuC-like enzyme
MAKYALLRGHVNRDLVPPHALVVPPAATDAELEAAHTPAYVQALVRGELERAAERRIGFPWSPQMVERSRRSVGATLAASRDALGEGVAVSLAGGTHHAFPDHGQGFCVFNDVAVAVRVLQGEGRLRRAVVIDTDVHQGDGTAFIFQRDDTVFTFSVHGEKNFPFRKQQSDLDIALPDGAGDDAWLDALARGLDAAFAHGPADLAYYLAGADAWEGDRLGRLAVSRAALAERDRMVLERCAGEGAGVVVVMGGGYAESVEDMVAIHLQSVEAAARLAEAGTARASSR